MRHLDRKLSLPRRGPRHKFMRHPERRFTGMVLRCLRESIRSHTGLMHDPSRERGRHETKIADGQDYCEKAGLPITQTAAQNLRSNPSLIVLSPRRRHRGSWQMSASSSKLCLETPPHLPFGTSVVIRREAAKPIAFNFCALEWRDIPSRSKEYF